MLLLEQILTQIVGLPFFDMDTKAMTNLNGYENSTNYSKYEMRMYHSLIICSKMKRLGMASLSLNEMRANYAYLTCSNSIW